MALVKIHSELNWPRNSANFHDSGYTLSLLGLQLLIIRRERRGIKKKRKAKKKKKNPLIVGGDSNQTNKRRDARRQSRRPLTRPPCPSHSTSLLIFDPTKHHADAKTDSWAPFSRKLFPRLCSTVTLFRGTRLAPGDTLPPAPGPTNKAECSQALSRPALPNSGLIDKP